MTRARTIFRSPFGSALLGGFVAVVLGITAIAAGVVTVDNADSAPAPPPAISPSEPAAGGARTVGEVYEDDAQGVAFIEAEQKPSAEATPFGMPPGNGGTATGSGFLIDGEGHLITNAHVVGGAGEVTVKFGDGDALPAKVVGADESTDIAVLSVDPESVDADPLPLGDSDTVEVGDGAIAIGNPYGLDRTVTSGIISALQRQISAPNGFTISDVLQTDAAINPGNSGGPLIDADGRVIGINSQIATGSGGSGSVGIGFAVPINTAKDVAEQIIDNGSVEHAYLGIEGADLTSEIAQVLNLDVDHGVLVQAVTPGGPADEAGLEVGDATVGIGGAEVKAGGDVITAVDGREVTGMEDLIAAVNAKQPGDEVGLTVLRDDSSREISVELGDRPDSAQG
ncbi:MAG TPA: trypsin-like peptidase domain-containing protein [Solirubrobacterales bacterium]|nr:trypsin-like peptidase domain-containing protein [Solirubrobacterales bacterium]